MTRVLGLLLAALPALAPGGPPSPMELAEVARLPYFPYEVYTCGDANGDGSTEFYAFGQSGSPWWEVFAIEYAGGAFDTTRLGWPQATIVWGVGDADRDGLVDLVVQRSSLDGHYICLYESTVQGMYPDSLVWTAEIPYHGSTMNASTCHLDGDSAIDLVLRDYPEAAVRVYECTGDNAFTLVGILPRPGGVPLGLCPTLDLDCDGRPEVACGTDVGIVAFYEAISNNLYTMVSACTVTTPRYLRAVTSTRDMDRDGRPELVVLGVAQSGAASLMVFESSSDDVFHIVDTIGFTGYYYAEQSIAAGDIDGDSIVEFAVTDGDTLRIFRCTGPDTYEQCWSTHTWKQEVGLYDINRDGHCELLYRYANETVICQYVSGGIVANEAAQLRAVEVSPSVLRPGARLNLSGLPPDARVELLDVSGRVCFESGSAFILPPSPLSPGAYFVRITSGSQSITRKVLVVE